MTRNTGKKKDLAKDKPEPKKPLSNEALRGDIEVKKIKAEAIKLLALLFGLAVCIAACGVPAYFLAGEETLVNVTVGLSLTVVATLTGGGAVLWGRHHKRRADRLEERNKQLSRDVKELQSRLEDNKLSSKVSR